MKRGLLLLTCALALATARGEGTSGMLVTTPDAQSQFLLSDVAEVTFTDTALNLQLLDNSLLSFPNSAGWTITFNDKGSGLSALQIADAMSPASVYTPAGIKVATYDNLSAFSLQTLPKGVYIVVCKDKTFKVVR